MSNMSTLTQAGRRTPTPPQQKWNTFTADELVDAYEQGKEEGRDKLLNIVNEKRADNQAKAFQEAEKFFHHLEENTEIEPKEVFMRLESSTEFSTLYLIPEDQYASGAMLEVMQEAKSRELEIKSNTFFLSFGFMPYTEHTNRSAIVADGFYFSYPLDEQQ